MHHVCFVVLWWSKAILYAMSFCKLSMTLFYQNVFFSVNSLCHAYWQNVRVIALSSVQASVANADETRSHQRAVTSNKQNCISHGLQAFMREDFPTLVIKLIKTSAFFVFFTLDKLPYIHSSCKWLLCNVVGQLVTQSVKRFNIFHEKKIWVWNTRLCFSDQTKK